MIRWSPLLSLFIFLTPQKSDAQKAAGRVVSGQVICQEDGTGLPGVLVYSKGSKNSSGTQQDGMYYIEVTDRDSVLVFSLDEFQTREVRLTKADNYPVVLARGQAGMDGEAKLPEGAKRAEKGAFPAIGLWRAVFQVRPGVDVPVIFDIRAVGDGELRAFFHNAEEQFEGGRVKVTADSLFVLLDQFDNELAFRLGEHALAGVLRRQDGTGSPLPVKAEAGVNYRFPESGAAPAGNISGTYDIVFKSESGKEEKAVGLFRQEGNKLQGTFLRATGDSRYLEGIVEGSDFYLSSFIGSAPSYYKGSFTTDGQLTGEVLSARGGQAFTGTLNAKAALPDPYALTYLKAGYSSFDFSLPDADGRKVSLADEKFKNKVVIVTIGGTWCPNCVDEASFLAPWYKANHGRGVEVISIQYERQTDPSFVRKVLTRMRDRYDIQYDQVFGGMADKQEVAKSLPALNTFLAFPTTIIIDKKGRVAEIHTGYSGPATGIYYQQFLKAFNEEINKLLRG
jgi:peroxiredoxin